MRIFSRKRTLGALTTLVLLAGIGVATGYLTSTGSGEGTAPVSSASTANIVVSSATSGELYPLASAPAANTAITVRNPGAAVEYVKEVTATAIAVDAGHSGCKTTWLQFDGTTGQSVAMSHEVAPGGTYTVPGAATLWLKDSSTEDQSACEGATVTVSYTSD